METDDETPQQMFFARHSYEAVTAASAECFKRLRQNTFQLWFHKATEE